DAAKANAIIRSFLTKLYNEKLSEAENVLIATLMHNLTRLERINDHTAGIAKKAEELRNGRLEYSEEILAILRDLSGKTMACYVDVIDAFAKKSHADITALTDEIQMVYEHCKALHLERVSNAEYSIKSGTIFLETVRHLSRIASNSKSIAENLCS
ncbi:MAG: hypothetical protein LBC86_06430, partial [Oscillospiraceae bacterium]|nr:hypothetical protein [Oscillospiraceae bacterium]